MIVDTICIFRLLDPVAFIANMFFLVDSSSSAFSYAMFSKQNILILYIQIYNFFVLCNVYVLIRPFPF